MVSRRFAIGTAIALTAAAVLHGDGLSDEQREWARMDEFSERLRLAAAAIAGLTLLQDSSDLAGSIATRPGVRYLGCRSYLEVFAAVGEGNVGCLDTAIETCAVALIGDGRYFCSTTGGDDFVASNLAVASEWLATAVGLSAMIDSTVLSG